jgi:hypothetical protein
MSENGAQSIQNERDAEMAEYDNRVEKEGKLHFDAFRGLVLGRKLTGGGRVQRMKILTLHRFLENGRGVHYEPESRDAHYLEVAFGPDKNALSLQKDFPPGCPVRGRVQGPVKYCLRDSEFVCVPGSLERVRDKAEDLTMADALHEKFDDAVRSIMEGSPFSILDDHLVNPEEMIWLRFFLRRFRKLLSAAGILRPGQRSRRLHGDWSEVRIIPEAVSGLPGVILAALCGNGPGIPRILACGAPVPAPPVGGLQHNASTLGSHREGWYDSAAFCAVSLGDAPRILEGAVTVPEERLPDVFSWIRLNKARLSQLWRMSTYRAADWPLENLRKLEDAPAGWDEERDPWEGNLLFEQALERLFGDALRADEQLCARLWGSMVNVQWLHADGAAAGFSFREAGAVIAEIRGEGKDAYMHWYMSGEDGKVHSEIGRALEAEGWIWAQHESYKDYDAVDVDAGNDDGREYDQRVRYYDTEMQAERELRRVEKLWNKLCQLPVN